MSFELTSAMSRVLRSMIARVVDLSPLENEEDMTQSSQAGRILQCIGPPAVANKKARTQLGEHWPCNCSSSVSISFLIAGVERPTAQNNLCVCSNWTD